jgi:hypothetical protein
MKRCKPVAAGNNFSMEAEDTVGIHYLADTEDIEDIMCTIVRS